MKKEVVKKNYILFVLVLVFVLGLIAGNIWMVVGEPVELTKIEDLNKVNWGDIVQNSASLSTSDLILKHLNSAELSKLVEPSLSQFFIYLNSPKALNSILNKAILGLDTKQTQKWFDSINDEKANAWPLGKIWTAIGKDNGFLTDESKKKILKDLNEETDANKKSASFKRLWASLKKDGKPDEAERSKLIALLNDKDDKSIKLKNDFLKAVLEDIMKESKYKNTQITFDLGSAKVSYETGKFYIGNDAKTGTEITLNEWISSVKVDTNGKISVDYSNQGFEANAAKRTIVFPTGAKTLLDENGNYKGVNVLYGNEGTVTITSKGDEDTYAITYAGGKQAAIFVNGVIYTGSSFTVKSSPDGKSANVIGSTGAAEAWFNLDYADKTKPKGATSYGYLKLNDGTGVITGDPGIFGKATKGVLLTTNNGVTLIVFKGVNGVDIVGGGDVSKVGTIRVASEGSSGVRVARFSDGQVQVAAGTLVPYTFEGNIGGFVSSDIQNSGGGSGGGLGDESESGNPSNPGQVGGNMGGGAIIAGQFFNGAGQGPIGSTVQQTRGQLQFDSSKVQNIQVGSQSFSVNVLNVQTSLGIKKVAITADGKRFVFNECGPGGCPLQKGWVPFTK